MRVADVAECVIAIATKGLGRMFHDSVTMTTALLVFYSRLSRDRLERILRGQGMEVYLISGRGPDATETIRMHPADVVVIDKDVADISVTQAVRHIAQILPLSPIFTASADHQRAEVYRKGRQVGTVNLGEILHFEAGAVGSKS